MPLGTVKNETVKSAANSKLLYEALRAALHANSTAYHRVQDALVHLQKVKTLLHTAGKTCWVDDMWTDEDEDGGENKSNGGG